MSRTATFTADFRDEFESERTRWLRRRFLWWTGTVGVIGCIQLITVVLVAAYTLPGEQWPWAMLVVIVNGCAVATFVSAFTWAKRHVEFVPRERLLRIVSWVIVIVGVLNLLEIPIQYRIGLGVDPDKMNASANIPNWMAGWMGNLMVIHLFASAFIPWTPRESLRPVVPLIAAAEVVLLTYGLIFSGVPFWVVLLVALFLPLAAGPGLLVAWWRHGRFRKRFFYDAIKGRYTEMKRELVDAQRIHDALFPKPVDTGEVRFGYFYEPMRQIGGDYLFARTVEAPGKALPMMNIVLIDVTGHGVSAALTVNRLHGEIEREIGEDPSTSPGQMLTGLNSYVHHTLATHSVYATALCLQFDPNEDALRWASAGHPPAFLRAIDGTIHQLDSTTFVLGACHGADFDPHEQSARFARGDVLVAYTDGATEARDANGRMLRVEGIQRIICSAPPDGNARWADRLSQAIRDFRYGSAQDDTLIVEVYRPIEG